MLGALGSDSRRSAENSLPLSGLWAFGITGIRWFRIKPWLIPELPGAARVDRATPLSGCTGDVENMRSAGQSAWQLPLCFGLSPPAPFQTCHWPSTRKRALADTNPRLSNSDLNWNYDNDDEYYVYVYAHSRRDLIKLVDLVNRIAQRSAKPGETGITIVSNEYWPLPWYFRDYQRVGYYGSMSASSEPVIIARDDQRSQMEASFGGRYRLIQSGLNDRGTFALRPGVDLLLYVRNDIPAP